MNIMEINHITKDYGGRRGVFDLCFSVKRGEIFGFLGPNGAGKTTTIRQLLGFIRPDSGTISILGMDCFRDAAKIQTSLGYLPGEIAFMDEMTGIQFLRFSAGMKGLRDFARAQELIQYFDLDASVKIRKMSKGMKQKLGIVCAFMTDPDILILDEPTSGLDPLMQNRFIELILQEKKNHKTILMSSHIFEEVERTCDRTAIIRAGHLVDIAQMDALQNSRRKICRLLFGTPQEAAAFSEGHAGSSIRGCWVTLPVAGSMEMFIRDLSRYSILDMEMRSQTLEELFMHFYGGESDD